ncbi:MAG: peptide chain release factor N(5)-glutamine methyltransferase [Prevotella sp.]|nr:peptide chain release factor N(5)-glutamine methyltransferase [Prevotella sp.]
MTYDELWRRLAHCYAAGEAKAIVRLMLGERFGLSATDIYCGKVSELSANDQQEVEEMMLRLEQMEPVQYVLGTADFCGRRFGVSQGVLIPRPETEELCLWIVEEMRQAAYAVPSAAVLDIGTGSGCIACTLAAELPTAQVTAWDVSEQALTIARQNADRLGTDVTFVRQDLFQASRPAEPRWDVIVSNPPYICRAEAAEMERNVLDYEPHEALFVPDDDPLRFYRAIAGYARSALRTGGRLYFEINRAYATATAEMLERVGFAGTEIKTDQFGHPRMLRTIIQ